MRKDMHLPLFLWIGGLLVAHALLLPADTRFEIQAEESQLQIKGTSTIHDWTCHANQLLGSLTAEAPTLHRLQQAEVHVPVQGIDCGNGTMDKKMRRALDWEAHPIISFTLTEAALAAAVANTFEIVATGDLALAGETRAVEMTVAATWLTDGHLRLVGTVPLLMTDYGIAPPKAMLGTLKTGDRVEVRFNVVLAAASMP